ncbi:MAG: hypothetical protein HOH74_04805 [Gemmatimonadetes bacterium]|nr:hypothetical protein [Gemmatimonadota bacterium]
MNDDLNPITVATPDAAVAAVGLPADLPVRDLTPSQWEAFGRLVGWEEGGPVVAPLAAEQQARARRQQWKQAHHRVEGRCLLLDDEALRHARGRLETCAEATDFGRRLRTRAQALFDLGTQPLLKLIPPHAPWNTAGSFCPACIGRQSVAAIHSPFWHWSVETPDRIQCPHCHIIYPHTDYAEHGRLRLPRLGIDYSYYLTPAQQQAHDRGRDGVGASSFGGGPTHVSLSGEVERCTLNWILGQLEPVALAAALFDEPAWGQLVGDLLERLAQVLDRYPIYSYRQEVADCDPAFAVEHLNALPTPLKRAACRYTYCGQFGDLDNLHGLGDNTTSCCFMPNGEWGAARLAREKASHGQLFLALMQAYDLVHPWLPRAQCERIEQGLLLEYYQDVEGLTRRIDNKSGPGAAARVACGLMFGDHDCVAAGVDRFEAILHGQFYEDGSWRETPIYGAKALVEGLWQVPELMRRRQDLYAGGVLRRALTTYAEAATPLGTQPSLDDGAVDFGLSPHLVDLARLRLGIDVPLAPLDLSGLRTTAPAQRLGFAGYVPRWEMALVDDDERLPGDGGCGFAAVGHLARPQPAQSWVRHLLGESLTSPPPRTALHRFFRGRGLVCLGFGEGPRASQLYLDGGDGISRHRHLAPLQLSMFAGGFEVFPDMGYIADHPANAWVRTTASHNSALVDGQPLQAAGRCHLRESWRDDGMARAHVIADVVTAHGDRRTGQRRVTLMAAVDGWPLMLLDELMIPGPGEIDHVMCVNADPDAGDADHFAPDRAWTTTAPAWDVPIHVMGDAASRIKSPAGSQTVSAAANGASEDPAGKQHPLQWRQGGPIRLGDRWRWHTDMGAVGAIALSTSSTISTFRSPAWRTYAEIQAAPGTSWRSVVVRQNTNAAGRILYLIGGDAQITAEIDNRSGCVVLQRPGARRSLPLPRQLSGTI